MGKMPKEGAAGGFLYECEGVANGDKPCVGCFVVKGFLFSMWVLHRRLIGNEVWFRSKTYQGKAEKEFEAAGSRWKKGWYRGSSLDVERGLCYPA